MAVLPDTAAAAGGSNTNRYEEALDMLRPLQPVLWGFNHRNRNQHRRAAWWGAFGMLRRRVDKLVDELADAAARSQSAVAKKGKKRKLLVDEEEKEKKEEEEKVRDHVRWLRDVLVPKCYLAFSQLTADNQFATLGVVLLGALAQVHAACAQLVGDAAADHDDSSAAAHGLPKPANNTTSAAEGFGNAGDDAKQLALHVPSNQASRDLVPGRGGGAVVSRDEVARAEKLRRKKQKLEGGSGSLLESSETLDLAKGDQKYGGDDTASKVKVDDTKNTPDKRDLKPPKKKKKAKKGGDEFDNLFKGLF